jgi:tetratricopeptide (TPR) repeat protein
MTDELTTELARISSLSVVSRTSVQQYRDTRKALPAVGRELGVDAIVEGSVAKGSDRLRITVQLVDARSDRHVWAETLERSLGDAASIQHQLAQEIANQIGVQLTPLEQQYFARHHPIDAGSFQAYLQGRYYANKRTPNALAQAETYFQDAAARDPNNPLAEAGLADTYLLRGIYTRMSWDEAIRKARATAEKAIALDDQLAEAHCSAAYIGLLHDWDFSGAEKEFRRALQLNPNSSTAHQWYAELLSFRTSHHEALNEIRRAEELDPFSMIIHHEAGQVLQNAGQYRLALEEYGKAEALEPDFFPNHYAASLAHRRLGEYDQAIRELRRRRVERRLAGPQRGRYPRARLRDIRLAWLPPAVRGFPPLLPPTRTIPWRSTSPIWAKQTMPSDRWNKPSATGRSTSWPCNAPRSLPVSGPIHVTGT